MAAAHPILFLEDPVGGEGDARLEITEPLSNVFRVVPVVPDNQGLSFDAQCEIVLSLVKAALHKHWLLRGKFDSPIQWFLVPRL